jgi:hypothetical protein
MQRNEKTAPGDPADGGLPSNLEAERFVLGSMLLILAQTPKGKGKKTMTKQNDDYYRAVEKRMAAAVEAEEKAMRNALDEISPLLSNLAEGGFSWHAIVRDGQRVLKALHDLNEAVQERIQAGFAK